jgi:dienelactone hydrolase
MKKSLDDHLLVALAAAAILMMLISFALAASPERIDFPLDSNEEQKPISGYLFKPAGPGPFPAVIALHGCGGIFTTKGDFTKRHADWTDRWLAAGYAVLFPDSFGSRDLGSVCKLADRRIRPRQRADDVAAAVRYLATQPSIDRKRIALVGWSNGGSAVLWAVRKGFSLGDVELATAIAFYPGCRPLTERPGWSPRLDLTVLIGADDNWTSPVPCRTLRDRTGFTLIEYPGAVHDFDAPGMARRTRTGLAFTADGSGRAEVGTDEAGRKAAIEQVTGILAKAFNRKD